MSQSGKCIVMHTVMYRYIHIIIVCAHFMSGIEVVAYYDERPFLQPTIRHNTCELIIASGGRNTG